MSRFFYAEITRPEDDSRTRPTSSRWIKGERVSAPSSVPVPATRWTFTMRTCLPVNERRFFYADEITRPEDVIPRLAKQERDWKKGYSAYELAYSWINAGDIPASVRSVLDSCPDYAGAQLIEGLFEREVDLRTPGHPSQTDLLAFVKLAHGNAVDCGRGPKVASPLRPARRGPFGPGRAVRPG